MLSRNAVELIKARYQWKNESIEGVFQRVAKALAIRDSEFEKELYDLMINEIFLPNSPCLRNAGRKRGALSACFVLPIEDSMSSIFETIRNMALIFQKGGGVGINFSPIRPKDSPLSSGGTSSGAVSFMGLFDAITEIVKQGGFRRGAAMFALSYSHPEILDFCRIKMRGKLTNANLSVAVNDRFMKKANNRNGQIHLKHDGKIYTDIRANDILELIALGSWMNGDPGIVFLDRINKDNKNPEVPIECTNPCGEQPLPPYGACTLGSINISKFVKENNFDFGHFYEVVKLGSKALLNSNLINIHPLPQITKIMHELNPFGLGIMGFADTLIMLGIKYDSQACLDFIKELGKPYVQGTEEASPDSFYKRSIAPTGSLSILADCSFSIEPIYAKEYERHVVAGIFKEGKDIYKSEWCRTAHEISPEWHLKVQAAFQSFVDSGVSKTINVPNTVSVDEIKKIYIEAWKLKVKGVTIFREGSIEGVLKLKSKCEGDSCHL